MRPILLWWFTSPVCRSSKKLKIYFKPFEEKIMLKLTSTLFLSFLLSLNVLAGIDCSKLIKDIKSDYSLGSVIERTAGKQEESLKNEPMPITSNITKRRAQKWTGEKGPKSFEAFLGKGTSFLKTPDPNTEHPLMAMRKNPNTSSMLHVETDFMGEKLTTKAYVSKPNSKTSDKIEDSEYLIGPEYDSVVWHVHGGGTPSAVAGNASSKALYYNKRGIPVLAVDQPGHGNGPTFPFLNDQEILDWNYEMIKKLVHPSVKVHFHGHSWGGMFTARFWYLAESGKYDRIVAFQSESPGVDNSLGKGTAREAQALEAAVNDNMDEWIGRASEDDLEFVNNVVENRKMSPVAQEFTSLTSVFYRNPLMTEEQKAQRRRINTLVGIYDALVYTGREGAYDKYFSNISGENYYKFTEGKTFKGPNIKQGHQIFDLVDDSGDFIAYKIGVDLVREMSPSTTFDIIDHEGSLEDVTTLLNRIFSNYANNFAFREYLNGNVEYVELPNSKVHGRLIGESSQLKKYFGSVGKITKSHESLFPSRFDAMMKPYHKKYEVNGDLKRALRELNADVSPKRKQELRDYIDAVKAAEKDFEIKYEDKIFAAEMEKFTSDLGGVKNVNVPERVLEHERLADAQRVLNNQTKRAAKLEKGSQQEVEAQRVIRRVYEELGIPEEQRDIKKIAKRIEELKTYPISVEEVEDAKKKAIIAESKKFDKNFARLQQRIKEIKKTKQRRYMQSLEEVTSKVKKPKGIKGRADAEWEIKVDLTEERKAQLEQFIAGFEAEEKRVRTELADNLKKDLDGVSLPKGYESTEQAADRLVEINETLEKRFRPSKDHPNYEKVSEYLEQMEAIDKELERSSKDSITHRSVEIQNSIERLKKEKSQKVMYLEKTLEKFDPEKSSNEVVLKAFKEDREKLDALTEINGRLYNAQNDFYLTLHENNQLTRENILNTPDSLKKLALEYENALAEADQAANNLKAVLLKEAAANRLLFSKNERVENLIGVKLQEAITSLLGDYKVNGNVVEASEESIEARLIALEKELAQTESTIYKLRYKLDELEELYQEALFDGDATKNVYEVSRVVIYELLDMDYKELVKLLSSKEGKVELRALKKMLKNWEDMWTRVRIEDNFAQANSYNVAQ